MRWTEEAAAINESELKTKQIKLEAHELTGYAKLSNALLADNAVGLESILYQMFGAACSWYEDYAMLRGNGAGKPLGLLTWAGRIGVARSAVSAFALQGACALA